MFVTPHVLNAMSQRVHHAHAEARCGLLPVRCYSCNRVLGTARMHERYTQWVKIAHARARQKEIQALTRLVQHNVRVTTRSRSRGGEAVGGRTHTETPTADPVPQQASFMEYMGLRGRFCCARTLISTRL